MTISATKNVYDAFQGLKDTRSLVSLAKIKKPELITDQTEIQNLCHHLGKWIAAEGNLEISSQRREIAGNFFQNVFETRMQLAQENSIPEAKLKDMNLQLIDIIGAVTNEMTTSQQNAFASKEYQCHDQLYKHGLKQNDFSNIKDNILEKFAKIAKPGCDSSVQDQKMLFVALVEKTLNNEDFKAGKIDFNDKLSQLLKENVTSFSPEGIKHITTMMKQGQEEAGTLGSLNNKHMVTVINNKYDPNSLDQDQHCIHMQGLEGKSKEEIYSLYEQASAEDIAKVNDFIHNARGFRLSRNPKKDQENISKIGKLEKHINEELNNKQQAYLSVICQKKKSNQSHMKILDLVKDLPLGGVAFTSVLGGMLGGLFGAPVMGVFVAFVLEILSKLDNQAGADQTKEKEGSVIQMNAKQEQTTPSKMAA